MVLVLLIQILKYTVNSILNIMLLISNILTMITEE